MNDRTLIATGIIGTAVAAVCCFTPVPAALLSAVGLSAALGYLDYISIPALAIFGAITVYAVAKRNPT